MLEKLTQEQVDLQKVVSKEWIDAFNNNTTFNEDEVVKGIEWVYKFSKLDKPQVIIVDNPKQVQVVANRIMQGKKEGEPMELEYITPCSYLDYSNSGWCSYYDYFTRIGVLDNEDFNTYSKLIKQGIYYTISLDSHCIVSKPPIEVHVNKEGILNNIDSEAIVFKGYALHAVNGVIIDSEIFHNIKSNTFTLEEFVRIPNEEVKSACISMIEQLRGTEGVYIFFKANLKEISTYTDIKDPKYLEGTTGGMNVGVYSLFRGHINKFEVSYLRCYCPSTDRMFFLGTDNHIETAKDAVASLYRVPRMLVKHLKEIRRQGERFTSLFTEEGKEILRGMTQEQASDLVSVDGDTYFNLITYEY